MAAFVTQLVGRYVFWLGLILWMVVSLPVVSPLIGWACLAGFALECGGAYWDGYLSKVRPHARLDYERGAQVELRAALPLQLIARFLFWVVLAFILLDVCVPGATAGVAFVFWCFAAFQLGRIEKLAPTALVSHDAVAIRSRFRSIARPTSAILAIAWVSLLGVSVYLHSRPVTEIVYQQGPHETRLLSKAGISLSDFRYSLHYGPGQFDRATNMDASVELSKTTRHAVVSFQPYDANGKELPQFDGWVYDAERGPMLSTIIPEGTVTYIAAEVHVFHNEGSNFAVAQPSPKL